MDIFIECENVTEDIVSQNMNKRKLNTYNLCSQIDLIIS